MTIEEIIKAYQPLSMEEAAEILQVYEDLQTALNLLRDVTEDLPAIISALPPARPPNDLSTNPWFINLKAFLSRFPDPKNEGTE